MGVPSAFSCFTTTQRAAASALSSWFVMVMVVVITKNLSEGKKSPYGMRWAHPVRHNRCPNTGLGEGPLGEAPVFAQGRPRATRSRSMIQSSAGELVFLRSAFGDTPNVSRDCLRGSDETPRRPASNNLAAEKKLRAVNNRQP